MTHIFISSSKSATFTISNYNIDCLSECHLFSVTLLIHNVFKGHQIATKESHILLLKGDLPHQNDFNEFQ